MFYSNFISNLKNQYYSTIFNAPWSYLSQEKEAFFLKNKQLFDHHESWRAALRTASNNIINDLKGGKLKIADIHTRLVAELNTAQANVIISPSYYHHILEKFAKDIRQVFPQFNYINNQASALKQDAKAAAASFYQDILVHLLQLSAQQLTTEKFLQRLSYYQNIISADVYQNVMGTLEAFIQTHYDSNLQYDLYSKPTVSADYFENLLANIEQQLPLSDNDITKEIVTAAVSSHDKENKATTSSWFKQSFTYITNHPGAFVTKTLLAFSAVLPVCNAQYNFAVGTQVNLSNIDGINGFSNSGFLFASGKTCNFNGDEYGDIVFSGGPPYTILFGGEKIFPSFYNLYSVNYTTGIVFDDIGGDAAACTDMNGDGRSEAAFSDRNTNTIYVAYGTNNTIYSFASFKTTTPGLTSFSISDVIGFGYNNVPTFLGCDINKDGFDEFITGSLVNRVGTVSILAGQPETYNGLLNLTTLIDDGNVLTLNNSVDTQFGSILDCGDVNADGISDLLIGNYQNIYVFYGHLGNFTSNVINYFMDGIQGTKITASNGLSYFTTGDINGDNTTDIAVSALQSDSYIVYVYYGQNNFPASVNLDTYLNGTTGFSYTGPRSQYISIENIVSCKLNNDPYYDLVIANPYMSLPPLNQAGLISGLYGAPSFPAKFTLNNTNSFTIPGITGGQSLGEGLACFYNINGNNLGTLLTSAEIIPSGDTGSYALFSYSTSITPSPSVTPSQTPSISTSPSVTPSISISPTSSASSTPTPTPSITTTPSITPSATPSVTPSNQPPENLKDNTSGNSKAAVAAGSTVGAIVGVSTLAAVGFFAYKNKKLSCFNRENNNDRINQIEIPSEMQSISLTN